MAYLTRQFRVICSIISVIVLVSGCSVKTIPVTAPNPFSYSDQCVSNADKMAENGQYKTSNFYIRKAIDIYERNQAWEKAIRCYIKLGDNYQRMDDFGTALGTLNKALDLTKSRLGYQNLELAKSFQRLAFKYLGKKDYDRALDLYRKALAIELEILGPNHPNVSKTYNSIALVQLHKNQIMEANTNYINSKWIKMKYSMKIPQELEKKFQSTSLENETYQKGQFNTIRSQFSQSLEEYRKNFGKSDPLFASIYEKIGILYALEKEYDQALEFIRKGFEIRSEAFGEQSIEASKGYLNIGICLLLKGDFDDAESYIQNALTISLNKLGEFHPDNSDIYCQLGKVYFQQGKLDEALETLQKALIALVPGFKETGIDSNPSLEGTTPKDKLMEILSAKANALRMKYILYPEQVESLHTAYSTYTLLARLLEIMRRSYKSEDYKLFFGEKNHPIFQQAIQVSLFLYEATGDSQYIESAFFLSEKSKAGVLAESIYVANVIQFAGIPQNLLDSEKNLRDDLTYYDTYLQKEYREKNPNQDKIRQLESKYYALVLDYQQLIDTFEQKYPDYFSLKYNPQPLNISDIYTSLDPQTAMIEYFVGDNILHIFVLTDKNIKSINVNLNDDLARLVQDYKNTIKKIEETPFLALSFKLYRLLIGPIEPLIKGKSRLIIIPDDVLISFPFESLTGSIAEDYNDLSKIDFMIKTYTFTYHYSANLWYHSLKTQPIEKDASFIGFAPVFGETETPGYILSDNIPGTEQDARPAIENTPCKTTDSFLLQLPASEEELRSIFSLFKNQGKKAVGYFFGKATKSIFKSEKIKNFNWIHVATHTLSEEDHPELEGLVFSKSGEPGKESEENVLYSGEVYNMNFNADLIVLSSCESGLGKLVKGEGMMALNRGFFYAGIRNIVFSLWKVEDRSTSRLMISFYRNILRGLPYARALQKAKLELIQDPFTAFPKYWSGFVLLGK